MSVYLFSILRPLTFRLPLRGYNSYRCIMSGVSKGPDPVLIGDDKVPPMAIGELSYLLSKFSLASHNMDAPSLRTSHALSPPPPSSSP